MKRKRIVSLLLGLALFGAGAALAISSLAGLYDAQPKIVRHIARAETHTVVVEVADRMQTSTSALRLQNPDGSIRVRAVHGAPFSMRVHVTVETEERQEAERVAASFRILPDANDGRLDVSVPNADPRVASVDWELSVPASWSVRIDAEHGEVHVEGMSGMVVASSLSGEIRIEGARGGMQVSSETGAISSRDSGGSIAITTTTGAILVRGASTVEPIVLRSEFGNVQLLESSGADVVAVSSTGSVSVDGLEATGTVALSSRFGELSLQRSHAVKVDLDTRSGGVLLQEGAVQTGVEITAGSGDVRIERWAAQRIDVAGESAAVEIIGLACPSSVSTKSGDVHVRDAEAAAPTIVSNSGDIRFAGSLASDQEVRFESESGTIELRLHGDVHRDLTVQTTIGNLRLPSMTSRSRTPDGKQVVGKLGDGGAALLVRTTSGDISLERAFSVEDASDSR